MCMRSFVSVLCGVVMFCVLGCDAAPGVKAIRLTAVGEGYDNYKFGDAVAIDGEHIAIASPGYINGPHGGIVYIYKNGLGMDQWGNHSGPGVWGLVKKLTVDDAELKEQFGSAVAISGDILAVAAKSDFDKADNSGSVYIFYRNEGGIDNWGLVKKLYASDAVEQGYFGESIALQAHRLFVGAIGPADTAPGKAYIFAKDQGSADNWGEVKKLAASDGTVRDNFGFSVVLDGDIAAVGARLAEESATTDAGKIYLYYRNEGGADNWGEKKIVISSTVAADMRLGSSVSLSGDVLAAGTGDKDHSAYLFYRNEGGADNWGEKKELVLPETGVDVTGYKVAVHNDILAVGRVWSGDSQGVGGVVHLYYKNDGGVDNWAERKVLSNTDPANTSAFGRTFALFGSMLLVGSPLNDEPEEVHMGSATLYNDYATEEKGWEIARGFSPAEIPYSEWTNDDDSLLSDEDAPLATDEMVDEMVTDEATDTMTPDVDTAVTDNGETPDDGEEEEEEDDSDGCALVTI